MANLFANAKLQYENNAGGPLAGGLLYTYAAGTNTPLTTWQDSAGNTPNASGLVTTAGSSAAVEFRGISWKTPLIKVA